MVKLIFAKLTRLIAEKDLLLCEKYLLLVKATAYSGKFA